MPGGRVVPGVDVSLARSAVVSESVIAEVRNLSAELATAAEVWGIAVPTGLEARLGAGEASGLRLDELVLAQACAAGDPRALAAFDAHFLSRIPDFLARHPARAEAAEVGQLLRERLLVGASPRIADYAGRGSLVGWLRVATLRTASNLRRAHRNVELPVAALVAASPELAILTERYGAGVQGALRDGFLALSSTERTLLRLHHLDGLTVDELAPIVGTSRATAGRRLLAARDHLGQLTLGLLVERTRSTPAELRSVLRVLVSRLDISLRGVMCETA